MNTTLLTYYNMYDNAGC